MMKTAREFVCPRHGCDGELSGSLHYPECDAETAAQEARDADWQARVDAARREGFETKLDELNAACDEAHSRQRDDCAKAVDAARAEGKAEGLRMALTQLPAMKPTGEDEEDPTCSVCKCMVSVESSDDWDDGDVCYHCAVELIPKVRAEIEALIAKAEK